MKSIYQYLTLSLIILIGCETDNKFDFTPAIGFKSTDGSITETNIAGAKISLYSNTRFSEAVTVTIQINNIGGLVYGDDYTIEPAPTGNTLTLNIDVDNEDPSFYVFPGLNGKERVIGFNITNVTGSNLSLGQQATLSYFLNIKSSGCPSGVQAVNVPHDFNTCTTDFATPAGFIEVFEPGSKTDRGWGCRAFGVGNSRAPRASAFGGTAGEDKAWMVMNPVRIAAGSNVSLTFSVFSNFTGPGVINVKWSSDYSGSGNPLTAVWHDLTSINSQFPAAGSQVWKTVNGSFTDICGENVYLAFQFSGANNTASASWDIDDLSFIVQ